MGILNKLFGRKHKAGRKGGSAASRGRRNFQFEGLERREMFAVSSLFLNGSALTVYTDNSPTSVTVSPVGTNIRITEGGTNRTWDFAASQALSVDFVGGAGNDRFVNNVYSMPTRAWGQGGDDYLEGYNGVDVFVGGSSGPNPKAGTKVLEDVPCDELPMVLERLVPFIIGKRTAPAASPPAAAVGPPLQKLSHGRS